MILRLILSLAFVGVVLWFAARVAKKRGLGGGGAARHIEVVARQRMGRSSTVNVVRIGDVVLVVGATEEQITLLAEVDNETIEAALGERGDARVSRFPARIATENEDAAFDDDGEYVDDAPIEHRRIDRAPTGGVHRPSVSARPSSSGALSGSVLDRNGWGSLVNQMRERTVRRP
jgi:flagellar protein FliO/FliZ